MAYVTLSAKAYAALMIGAPPDIEDTSEVLPDGSRRFEMDDKAYARLELVRNPGETDTDLVLRLAEIIRSDGHHRAQAVRRMLH